MGWRKRLMKIGYKTGQRYRKVVVEKSLLFFYMPVQVQHPAEDAKTAYGWMIAGVHGWQMYYFPITVQS